MRFIQAITGLLHALTIWRGLGIAVTLIGELREGANGIRGSLLILFLGLISRSAWSLVAVFSLKISKHLVIWHLAGSFLTWLSLVLLERGMISGD